MKEALAEIDANQIKEMLQGFCFKPTGYTGALEYFTCDDITELKKYLNEFKPVTFLPGDAASLLAIKVEAGGLDTSRCIYETEIREEAKTGQKTKQTKENKN